ncbi:tyrosine-type recombinase/integrase [Spirosoma pollinicola]|uniref:Integrase n=1 Tax=Spirosoma pollinicola TaxID=2057025 RepID=A0A2K8Z8C4_9BACT|nr:tyrosine-type recombinase/integrase [Spirosoma pollinicola]AUD06100.1 integrase [Spirosoma pollinicola]
MDDSLQMAQTPDPDNRQQAIGKTITRYTLSQLIRYFAANLPKSSNYPRHARSYVEFCLKHQFGIDGFSFTRYTAELPPNRVSPIRKFLLFYQTIGSPVILVDPKTTKIPPAANELVLRFIREAKSLRGDRSKETYTKALNAFFVYLDQQLALGQPASLGGLTVSDFVQQLKDQQYSAFTINLYLSAVKQLAAWSIRRRTDLQLNEDQLNALRDIHDVRGLAIERTFYKDSLEVDERQLVLGDVESSRDRAVLALLGLEGLRTVEVTRLKLGDLDFNRQQLLVLGKGKGTKKAIKFFASCRHILQTYLEETSRWPIANDQRSEYLFETLKTYQIRYIVDKQLKKHGLKRTGMSAHSLRHTAGQLLLDEGVSLEHVQQHLRHETLETTQFYTKKKTLKTYFQQMPD